MTEAAKRILDFAFNDLNLNRVDVKAFTENEASNALIKKLGFVFEGTQKQSVRSKATNKVHDAHIYGLLKEDWKR